MNAQSTSSGKILIVDDEESLRSFMEIMLSREGYAVSSASSGGEALERLKKGKFDLIVSDLMMPEMTGLELMGKTRKMRNDQPFIVMTAYGSVSTAIEAMKQGAADYITKPFDVEAVKLSIKRALEKNALSQENRALKEELGHNISFERIIGSSESIRHTIKLAQQVSQSDSTVLIRGESGVGKDLMARAIHNASPRASGPFVTINCAALPESLLESELFGHKKGSFTGAIRDKEGMFQAADGGTLFLDEIGNVSPAMQAKLLRALEDQMITPVGETKPVKVDVRLVAATNANLEDEVNAGRFRSDLYYRLNVIQLDIPPLRERPGDIALLAECFVRLHSDRLNKESRELSPAAIETLCRYSWPGNVRELKNCLERAVLLAKVSIIEPEDFPEKIRTDAVPQIVSEAEPPTPTLQSIEKAYIFFIMEQSKGNKSKASRTLGIDNSTLYRKLDRYGWNSEKSGSARNGQ